MLGERENSAIQNKNVHAELFQKLKKNLIEYKYFLKVFSNTGYLVDIYVLYNSSPNSFLSWVNSSDSSVTLAIN